MTDLWEWTVENPGWTSLVVIVLFMCLVYAPALSLAWIPSRRTVMAKNKKSREMTVSVLESDDGKFTANWSGCPNAISCNCLMVHAEKEGDPLTVSCCHPDVVAAAKKRAAQIDVPVLTKNKR